VGLVPFDRPHFSLWGRASAPACVSPYLGQRGSPRVCFCRPRRYFSRHRRSMQGGGIVSAQDVRVSRSLFRGRDFRRVGTAIDGVVVVRGAPEPWAGQGRSDEGSRLKFDPRCPFAGWRGEGELCYPRAGGERGCLGELLADSSSGRPCLVRWGSASGPETRPCERLQGSAK
jgi:hypothetical protein